MSSERWKQITPSQFPWEREALDYVREHLPDCDPYRVWANFEFIADDGTINEVDMLVLTPRGFFLVEIKADPAHSAAIVPRGSGPMKADPTPKTTQSSWQTGSQETHLPLETAKGLPEDPSAISRSARVLLA